MPVMSFVNAAASDVISTRILISGPGAAFVVVFLIWSVLESDLRQMYRFGGTASPLPTPPSGD